MNKHKWFIIIFTLAAIIRYAYIKDNVVPFLFDHGKDALAVLHMIAVPELKFIGPWTSIPGLYFGPAWYYLLAPFFYLSGFNPASAAVGMSILVLFQMYLVYKFFNIESSAIIGFSGFWIMISKSAWNPYPMTLLTIIILILLLKQLKLNKIDTKILAGLAFTSSLGFHFSSAFAVFYPLIIFVILFINNLRPNLKQIFLTFLAFLLPFIPQLLFELKNGFPQYHAIINYFFKGGEGDGASFNKLLQVISITFGESRNIVFESLPGEKTQLFGILFVIFVLISIVYILKNNKVDREFKRLLQISLIFVVIPMLGFLFLHFNLWYVYALIPVFTILIGTIISKLPKMFSIAFIVIYVFTGLNRHNYFLTVEKPKFIVDSAMYVTKLKVIDYIRNDAGDRSYSVYTYMPDIYDFPFQYEFLAQGLKGKQLPVEFAYEPNVTSYVKEKADLLAKIESKHGIRDGVEAEVIYYIVTDNQESSLLESWWGRQKYNEIVHEKKFGDRLIVYTATP